MLILHRIAPALVAASKRMHLTLASRLASPATALPDGSEDFPQRECDGIGATHKRHRAWPFMLGTNWRGAKPHRSRIACMRVTYPKRAVVIDTLGCMCEDRILSC